MKNNFAFSKKNGIVNINATTENVDIKMAEKKDDKEYLFEEWKECRKAIEQYGKFCGDLRKYGFTIITGLLSANAYLFISVPEITPWEKCAISSIMCLLIIGLFMSDRYYLTLVRGSVHRAIIIERRKDFPMDLTTHLHIYAKKAKIDFHTIFVYIFFIIISIIPSFVTVFTYDFLSTISQQLIFLYCLVIFLGSIVWIYLFYLATPIVPFLKYDKEKERFELKKKMFENY